MAAPDEAPPHPARRRDQLDKLCLFDDHWSPRIAPELNDSYVKLLKVKGELVWHRHPEEDEMFLVLRGRLTIRMRDGEDVHLAERGIFVVPRGTEHMPVADEEAQVLLVEKKTTVSTWDVEVEGTGPNPWV